MALDERQQGIREGAGLEESRLNTEFIDWLKRWGTTLLMVFAIAALGYALYGRYQRSQAERRDSAFVALESAIGSGAIPSPEALRALADEYPSVPGVRYVALTKAADAHLSVARAGVRAGATPDKDGVYAPADLLDQTERDAELAQAESLYNQVLGATEKDRGLVLHAIGAAYGLAAAAECRGDADRAKMSYERAAALAESAGIKQAGELAKKWAAEQEAVLSPPKLLTKSQLAKLPWADEKPVGDLESPLTPVEPAGPDMPVAVPTDGKEQPASPGKDTPPPTAPAPMGETPPATPPPSSPPSQPPPK